MIDLTNSKKNDWFKTSDSGKATPVLWFQNSVFINMMTPDSPAHKDLAYEQTRSGNQVFKSPSRSSSHYRRRQTPHFSKKDHPHIGQYVLGDKLGEGAFGRCYAARSERSGRRYALKVT